MDLELHELRYGILSNQSNHVHMAKMLTRIAGVIVTVSIRVPSVVAIINVCVVCVMKAFVIHRLGHALYTYEEHRRYQ